MDYIHSPNKTPFVNDKTLWQLALQRKPGYDDLIGWGDIENQRGKGDTADQAKLRIRYPTRQHYIQDKIDRNIPATGVNHAADWTAAWVGGSNVPSNYVMGTVNTNPWRNVGGRDYSGEIVVPAVPPVPAIPGPAAPGVPAHFQARAVPPYHYQRQWLVDHPNYHVQGFRGNPANVMIRRNPVIPPAAGAGPGAAGVVAVRGGPGGIVPALPAIGIF